MTIIKKTIMLSLSIFMASTINAWSFGSALSSLTAGLKSSAIVAGNYFFPSQQYPDLTQEQYDELYSETKKSTLLEEAETDYDVRALLVDGLEPKNSYLGNQSLKFEDEKKEYHTDLQKKALLKDRLIYGASRLAPIVCIGAAAYSIYRNGFSNLESQKYLVLAGIHTSFNLFCSQDGKALSNYRQNFMASTALYAALWTVKYLKS